jgi:CRISPR-associated protein (TIGR02710 family)
MKFVPLGNAYEQTGFLEAEKGRDLFNRYEFSSAAQIFDRLHPRVSAQADLFAGLGKLSRVLHRWELFEHYDQSLAEQFNDAFTDLGRCAYSTLLPEGFEEFLTEAQRLAAAIQEITAATKPTFLATADLVLNAERRLSQGHYDDAVARCYRALESLSQLYLFDQFKLDPSSPDYNNLSPEERDKVVAQVSPLPKEISLENGWRILFALKHPAALQIYYEKKGKLHNRFQGLLDDRNSSILAHGWRPVGAVRAQEWVSRLKELLNNVEGDKARSVLAKLQPPCLPGFWSAG